MIVFLKLLMHSWHGNVTIKKEKNKLFEIVHMELVFKILKPLEVVLNLVSMKKVLMKISCCKVIVGVNVVEASSLRRHLVLLCPVLVQSRDFILWIHLQRHHVSFLVKIHYLDQTFVRDLNPVIVVLAMIQMLLVLVLMELMYHQAFLVLRLL